MRSNWANEMAGRAAKEVALSLGTVPGLKKGELFLSFDAFRNDAMLEVLAHRR